MFVLSHPVSFVDNPYKTPSFILKKENNYAPLVKLTNDVNYLQQIDFAVQDLVTILYTMLSVMQEVEDQIQTSIESQLQYLRDNYPLKYTSYAKSCTTISSLLFSNNSVEFEDAQLSVIYNELLAGERLTLEAERLITGITGYLNEQRSFANKKINFINKYGNVVISTLDVVTNYREQNYITLVEDKIVEVETFFDNYYSENQ